MPQEEEEEEEEEVGFIVRICASVWCFLQSINCIFLFSGRDVVPSTQNSWHTSRNTVPSLALK